MRDPIQLSTLASRLLAGLTRPIRRILRRLRPIEPGQSDSDFVITLFETLLGRGASVGEFVEWRDRLSLRVVHRIDALWIFYETRTREIASDADQGKRPYPIMGTEVAVEPGEWRGTTMARGPSRDAGYFRSRFALDAASDSPRVSIITSLFRGGKFIERFLDNITSQTIFDRCELIIIDADSPDGERAAIEAYRSRFPQIVYLRLPYTATIYAAWNLAARMARGAYLTNANVDDLRRADSLELQAAALDSLGFVDVVYQDVLYSFDAALTFEEVAAIGLRSDMPIVSRLSLAACNPPHNAPMWRRSLHEYLGQFDDCLRSAADWDFWMRCLLAGKSFYKLNDPHVMYYVNPEGVSTSPAGPGFAEIRAVHKRHWKQLLPGAITEDGALFRARCGLEPGSSIKPTSTRYGVVQDLLRKTALEAESNRPVTTQT